MKIVPQPLVILTMAKMKIFRAVRNFKLQYNQRMFPCISEAVCKDLFKTWEHTKIQIYLNTENRTSKIMKWLFLTLMEGDPNVATTPHK